MPLRRRYTLRREWFHQKNAETVNEQCKKYGVEINALGYCPHPLTPDRTESCMYIDHIRKGIRASALMGVNKVNTFIGRDWTKTVDDN